MNKSLKFSAPILSAGGGGAYVEVPFDVEKELGSKRPKVEVLFEGKENYRGILTKMGTDCHILIVLKDIRTALNKQIGDTIVIELKLDNALRVVEVPAELQEAFKSEPQIATFFESLSYTCQKEYTQYITEAKKAETRERRAVKAIELLRGKVKTPR